MGVTVSLYLDERVSKKENLYPLKLRVTHNRQRSYFSISSSRINKYLIGNLEEFRYEGRESYSLNKITFEKITQSKPRGVFKDLQVVFRAFEMEYQQVADNLQPFVIEKFKEIFSEKPGRMDNDVFIQLKNKIDYLKGEKRYNSAMAYASTYKAIETFAKRKKLSFEEVSPKYLSKFNEWMLENSKSETTSGIYLRSLRSLFNDAIGLQITKNYPFYNNQNKSGFKIPSGHGRKIALSSDELKKIFDHKFNNKYPGLFYIDSWKLMYLLQGINPIDLCGLKYSNIQGKFIIFSRSKTKNSGPIEIRIPINGQIEALIKKWANHEKSKDAYIWPVFQNNDKEDHIRKVRQFIKMVNKYIKRLATELKIDKTVTTYVSRHTYATQLMRHGAPVAFISKQLGHTNTSTTDKYLNSFEEEQLKEWQKKISEF